MDKPASRSPQIPTPSATFVQADANTFRELVQRLTGPSDEDRTQPSASADPCERNPPTTSAFKVIGIKRSTSKLHERRQYTRSNLEIQKPPSFHFKLGQPILSPSNSGFYVNQPFLSANTSSFPTSPAVLSPSTPGFITSPLNTPTTPSSYFSNLSISEGDNPETIHLNSEEEEKAIKERRFYLHPSPRSRPVNAEPELLPLFPLTSPKKHKS